MTNHSIKNAERGNGGLTIISSAITSVWQGYGILTNSVFPSHERAARPWDFHVLSRSRVRNAWQGHGDRWDFE
eukprot:3978174-Pyramimonas_sp.AAC.1